MVKKLSIGKDITPIRTVALEVVDFLISLVAGQSAVHSIIYSQKETEALGGVYQILAAEADLKGITADELAQQVLTKAQEQRDRIASYEIKRQELRHVLNQATTEKQINEVIGQVAEFVRANGVDPSMVLNRSGFGSL